MWLRLRIRRFRSALACIEVMILCIVSSACSTELQRPRPDVVATFTILADISQQIAGDKLRVTSLTKPGDEIHGYEPSPLNIAAAHDAQLIIDNGLGLESWIGKLIQDTDTPRITATGGIDPLPIKGSEYPNPHAWMSPELGKVYVQNIVEGLIRISPDDADYFEKRAEQMNNELDSITQDMLANLESIPQSSRTLVSCEGAFSYLIASVGMQEVYLWPVNSDSEVTPQDVTRVADTVKKDHVPAVFCESTVDPGMQEQVIHDTGARNGGLLYVDSLTPDDGPADTYLNLLRYDTHTITDGLANPGFQDSTTNVSERRVA